MKIDPWDCKYFECGEYSEIDEDGEEWWESIYCCNNEANSDCLCELDAFSNKEQECPYAKYD